MQITGTTKIDAPRQRVWAALMDPDVLARCIDGVDRLDRDADGNFDGKMNAKVGPVRATFTGKVSIVEADEPVRYVLKGEGKGGVAGFAKGGAEIDLAEEDGGAATVLSYVATSQVGGKLAQLGARLIEGTAKGYAERFFENFKAEVEGPPPVADAEPVPGADSVPDVPVTETSAGTEDVPPFEPKRGIPPMVWAGVVIAFAAGIVVLQLL